MQRCVETPRRDWQTRVEQVGLSFHTIDGQTYWDESASYCFTALQIDVLEAATTDLHQLCLKAVESVIVQARWTAFGIAPEIVPFITRSWERERDRSLYGRFDLAWDGSGPPKLLEYNADTPTGLLEASVVQWHWLQDVHPQADQFNLIHEALVERFRGWGGERWHIATVLDHAEDARTAAYIADCATAAGMTTQPIDMADIGWNGRQFVDLAGAPMLRWFKLYPWEWLLAESFATQLLATTDLVTVEPAWKRLLSTKALLPLLWELFPDHPCLLRAAHEPFGDTWVAKPLLGREGANVTICENGRERWRNGGPYSGPRVYQQWHPLPDFSGNFPVIGSWIVGDRAVGIGIREDSSPITTDASRFVPHWFVANGSTS